MLYRMVAEENQYSLTDAQVHSFIRAASERITAQRGASRIFTETLIKVLKNRDAERVSHNIINTPNDRLTTIKLGNVLMQSVQDKGISNSGFEIPEFTFEELMDYIDKVAQGSLEYEYILMYFCKVSIKDASYCLRENVQHYVPSSEEYATLAEKKQNTKSVLEFRIKQTLLWKSLSRNEREGGSGVVFTQKLFLLNSLRQVGECAVIEDVIDVYNACYELFDNGFSSKYVNKFQDLLFSKKYRLATYKKNFLMERLIHAFQIHLTYKIVTTRSYYTSIDDLSKTRVAFDEDDIKEGQEIRQYYDLLWHCIDILLDLVDEIYDYEIIRLVKKWNKSDLEALLDNMKEQLDIDDENDDLVVFARTVMNRSL
ncbi:hypothetical protein AKO1_007489 [Acrasis kona]|uniref:Uncharacterized protein n=1 Tax=Acrasis kona TaxID=1008807 RepID=A0AAW2YSL7_9EUKA